MPMSENLPTNVQLDTNKNGSVSFATDVIATIAGLAATEVEGVASMYGGTVGLVDKLSRRVQNAKNLTRGVKVEVTGSTVAVFVSIIVEFGFPIPDVAQGIQENVKKAVETMSGLTVSTVDVHVQGLSFERENRAAAEIESNQRILLQKKEDKAPDKAAPAEKSAPAQPEEDPAPAEEDPAPAEENPAQAEEDPAPAQDEDAFEMNMDEDAEEEAEAPADAWEEADDAPQTEADAAQEPSEKTDEETHED